MSSKRDVLVLPCHKSYWSRVKGDLRHIATGRIGTLTQFRECLTQMATSSGCMKSRSQFQALEPVFDCLDAQCVESPVSGSVNSTEYLEKILPVQAALLLDMKSLFPRPIAVLRKGMRTQEVLTERQCLTLISAGFLCLLPEPSDKLQSLNFRTQATKLRCLLNYFRRCLTPAEASLLLNPPDAQDKGEDQPAGDSPAEGAGNQTLPEGEAETPPATPQPPGAWLADRLVTFHRRVLSSSVPAYEELWESPQQLLAFKFVDDVDACDANKDSSRNSRLINSHAPRLGGSVLEMGADSDEILMMEYPSMLAGLVLVEKLSASECVVVSGIQRYNLLKGSGASLRWLGDYVDECAPTTDGHVQREMAVYQIKSYKTQPLAQFSPTDILSELAAIHIAVHPTLGTTANKSWPPPQHEGEAAESAPAASAEPAVAEERKDSPQPGEQQSADVSAAPAGAEKPPVEERRAESPKSPSSDKTALPLPPKVPLFAYPPGCGAIYGGFPQLRFFLLWLASSCCERELLVRCPGSMGIDWDSELDRQQLSHIQSLVKQRGMTVGQLFGFLIDGASNLPERGLRLSDMLMLRLEKGL
ncbi:unnamed protein product [Vitrella brassicaformis CCMP3155]|uniref:poly(ADP-ribose) glycohydrolase n=1 Tax=Vitrella brassicaformis (strain CCMP3155) TaxID=1169540 RepID=A0A0G4ERE7_VITBC|nr:unnamed protein product [Vitrella brassicaformis CCMP3155]|eukprot:CEL99977.1 unnamed protein product [Vitrella brassicaformis CCMP3155]